MKTPLMNIVILDAYSVNPGDLSWNALETLGNLTVYDRTEPSQVIGRVKDADAVLTNKVVLDAATLAQMPRCRYIGVLATGYNVVDTQKAARLGITVTNIPAYSTMSVVQKVFALLLGLTDHVEWFADQNRRGRWSDSPDFCWWDFPLMELAGHNFAVIGLGHIGMAVAQVAHALGMNVMAMTSKSKDQLPEWITPLPLDQLLAQADVLSLHCPLTPDTNHIINADTIALMRPGAILINTGRGPLLDEKAVAKALTDNRLAGAGVDVLTQEPPAAGSPLLNAPRCIVTPHVAWATVEARTRLIDIAVANLRAFDDGHPVNVVS